MFRFEIREHRFFEIASSNRVAAIRYLQNEVSQVVNHAVQEEASSFQSLASEIFEDQTPLPIYSPQIQDQKHAFIHSSRTQVGRFCCLFDVAVLFAILGFKIGKNA